MSVTLLRANKRLRLAKVWTANGEIVPAARVAWFEALEIPINSIDDFSIVVSAIENKPRIALVKEAIAPGADPKRLRRRCEAGVDKRTREEYPAGLRVVERSWVVLDTEELSRPGAIDWRNGDALAAYVRGQLPEAFRDAACVWQFSGSSGHTSKRDEVRMHMFFMCDAPVMPQAWKGCFTHLSFVDESAFDKAHLVFTAAPIIHNGKDPINQRHGLLAGAPVVRVPADVKARSAQIARGDGSVKRRANMPAITPMPEAAAAFVDIIAESNILRSQHPGYRGERSRRLAFCALIQANFGVEDEAELEGAFHKACVGRDDPDAEHDAGQALDWARNAEPSQRTFSVRKLLCDASVALHKAGDAERATRAARLAMVFNKFEQECGQ